MNKVCIGLSGGADSVALLHFLKSQNLNLIAIHINHGISVNSDYWESFCRDFCQKLSVPFQSYRIDLNMPGNLEENARNKRYEIFKSCDADTVAVAHHGMDQIETVFMKMFRGSGIRGLSGMNHSSDIGDKKLIRPFLKWTKDDILKYCQDNNLSYIQDESNLDNSYDRNFIRNVVLPPIFSKIPFSFKGLMKMIDRSRETHQLVDDLALIDIEKCKLEENVLDWRALIQLPQYRVKNLFHYILYINHEPVSGDYLDTFVGQLFNCKIDSNTEYVGRKVTLKKRGKKVSLIFN